MDAKQGMTPQRWAEIQGYFQKTLDTEEMPDFWVKLAEHAPWVMDGYARMREGTLRGVGEGGALPKKVKELVIVALNILQGNVWGIHAHTRAAVQGGATVAEVAEIVALTIISRGMVSYRLAGHEALLAAEQAVAEYAAKGSSASAATAQQGD
jgi:AhpD family alkylhydroperoxidase